MITLATKGLLSNDGLVIATKGVISLGRFLGGFIKIIAITISEFIRQGIEADDDCDL